MSAPERPSRTLNETISLAVADDGSAKVRVTRIDGPMRADGVPPTDAPRLGRPSLSTVLGLDERVAPSRFQLRGLLGMGSSGQVYEVDDVDLARVAALKVLQVGQPDRETLAQFLHEARITASLTHPHVLPIYDIDATGDGRIYFTMPRIEGRSLGTLLDPTGQAAADPVARRLLDDPNALVTVAIAIAQVLGYAHHRQIVHQDIKPDNIMVGEYGEVWLLDWGSAMRVAPGAKPRIYGTPLYMSPEQARAERADARSDIYCLGATLFHALVRRCPTWDPDPDAFWRKKRSGAIDMPTAEERARVPAVLIDIALKAMAADPASRYASAELLLADLQAYQRGQAVSAHRESALEYAGRLWRAHGRRWVAATAVATVIAMLAGMLYGERLKEVARWGHPIYADDFDGAEPAPQWRTVMGGFRQEGGQLVSEAKQQSSILLDRRLSGPTAIEYDAEILPGSHRGDISLTWTRERSVDEHGRADLVGDALRLQIGAFDGAQTTIKSGDTLVAFSDFKPDIGRIYHVRDEIVGDRVSLAVDGRELCSWHSPFPLDDGYLVLYSTYRGHAFRHLRIYSQGLAQKIPATAVGDALVELRRYDDAAQAYARVAASFGDAELGREARYREGLCRWRLAQPASAFAAWSALTGTPWQGFVDLYGVRRDFAAKRFDQACAAMGRLCAGASPELLHEIAMVWGEEAEALCSSSDTPRIESFLALHDRYLAGESADDGQCADCLLQLGRNEELLARFPHQDYACAHALQLEQRWTDLIDRYPDQVWLYNDALLRAGMDERIERDLDPWAWHSALFRQCRFDEVMQLNNEDELQCYALLAQGKFDELDRRHPPPYIHDAELALTGHVDQVAEVRMRLIQSDQAAASQRMAETHDLLWQQAEMRIGLDEYIAGGAGARMDGVQEGSGRGDGEFEERVASCRLVLLPFLKALRGGWQLFDAALARSVREDRYRYQQQIWYAASYLTGAIDGPAFLAQPHRLYAQARLTMLTALRAERAGQAAAALAAYRAWQATPPWQRDCMLDPVWTRFAAWRIGQLAPAH